MAPRYYQVEGKLVMSFRFTILALVGVFSVAISVSGAAAQSSSTGTLTGRVMWCKLAPRPVGEGDGELSPLADVTPGMRQAAPPPITFPAQDLQLMIQGTSLSARTDVDGNFTLSGVPASQPLTLLVEPSPGSLLVLDVPSLMVSPGETLDLGTVGAGNCGGGGGPALVPQPAPVTSAPEMNAPPGADQDATTPDNTPGDPPAPADEAD